MKGGEVMGRGKAGIKMEQRERGDERDALDGARKARYRWMLCIRSPRQAEEMHVIERESIIS